MKAELAFCAGCRTVVFGPREVKEWEAEARDGLTRERWRRWRREWHDERTMLAVCSVCREVTVFVFHASLSRVENDG